MAKEHRDLTGVPCVRNNDGRCVVGEDEALKVWRDYMDELMNVQAVCDELSSSEPVEGPQCFLDVDEVNAAIIRCGLNKAPGPSGVTTEMIFASGDTGVRWMTRLCNQILRENTIPKDWTKSALVPIYKGKGDPLSCSSYRGLKLTEMALKIFERVLEKKIRSQVNIDAMKFGFMPGRATTDATFIMSQLQEKYLANNQDLYFAFIDLEKAFDRVTRELVAWGLRKANVEETVSKGCNDPLP